MLKMQNRNGYGVPDPLEEAWEFLLSVFVVLVDQNKASKAVHLPADVLYALGKVRVSEIGQSWRPPQKAHVYRGPVAVRTDSGGLYRNNWTI